MKTDIHPDYRPVVFLDTSSGEKFLTRSTVQTEETTEWEDGNTYPLAKIEISSASHPFFTGQMTIVDTAGRVERFERRYGKRRRAGSPEAKAEAEAKAKAEKAEAEAKAKAEAKAEKAEAKAKAKKAEAEAKEKAEDAEDAVAEANSEVAETETDTKAKADAAADTEATSEES